MFSPRIIPVLLLENTNLVKSIKFKKNTYIGDPINAIQIFNTLRVDELIILDILASKNGRTIPSDLVKILGEETTMPFAVGGGIQSIDQIQNLISLGSEKVVISSFAVTNPDFIKEASNYFGSSTIVVCMDVKKNIFGKDKVYIYGGKKASKYNPIEFAKIMEDNGAGEIIVQSISLDGTMSGYDVRLINEISTTVSIPVVALGGAGSMSDMKLAYRGGYASALAAGSMFVFHGKNSGVLINYPDRDLINLI
ncbi:imidazole glycerol phosphate synthase subunit HisF [bacterium]|jgi:imidazole glycerol-phosphate synthase subunit HisF|nr:imidazole glycerol phosphate synthase subunit HisF [bacterium]